MPGLKKKKIKTSKELPAFDIACHKIFRRLDDLRKFLALDKLYNMETTGFAKQSALENIARKYEIELLLLFGSRVSGKVHSESDYDLGYISRKVLDPREEGGLMIELAPVLEVTLQKMELVSLKGASPLFLKEAFTNAKVIYAKDNLIFDEYKIYALKYFEESKPMLENTKTIFKKRIDKYKQELLTRK